MKNIQKRRKLYSPILFLFIVIGLLSALYLVYERHHLEHAQNHIENIVDYDAVLRASSYEKRPASEAFKDLKEAGVTAMAIYDRTLEKANDAGQVRVMNAIDASHVEFIGAQVADGATYIFPVAGKEGYFKEIREDLEHRLGANRVVILNSVYGPVIEIKGIPFDSLKKMKLSISRLQAEEVIAHDFNVVVRPSNFKNETRSDVELVFKRIDGLSRIDGIVFVGKEVLGYPNHLDVMQTLLQQHQIPVVGIEAVNQLQYDPQMGFHELAVGNQYSVGRLYTVTKEEMKKLSPNEVAQWFYISDIERNIRFNLYPIYEEGVGNQTALATSIGYMKTVKDKLEERDFVFGAPSIYPPYNPSPILVVLVMAGSIALSVFMLSMLVVIGQRQQVVLLCTLLLLSVVLYVVTNGTVITQLWALAAAVAAPVVAITAAMDHMKQKQSSYQGGCKQATIRAVIYLVVAACLSAIGGMFIAGMLGNTRFFMEFSIFRGVKLTFVLPIILTAIAFLQRFPLWKGNTITTVDEGKKFLVEFFTIDIKLYVLVLVAILAGIAWIFVGRSGHTAGVPVPGIEVALRRFLENTLYARPREKEFLIGHPAFLIAVVACLQKWPVIVHFIATVAGVIGIASMVETFCHIRTPVYMSIMRGLDGLWMGIVIGIIAIIVIRFIMYSIHWYQKEESHNE